MRFVALICLVVLFVAASEARWGHRHQHLKEGASKVYPTCHFMSDKGTYDLRLFMRDLQGKDWQLTSATDSVFYFNPCVGVTNEACPKDSVLCQVTPKGGISFGNVSTVQWTEVDGGVEMAFANGEMCNNGKPRTTLVQFTCSEPTTEVSTHLTALDNVVADECAVTIKVTSMYGCPAEQLCTVYDQTACDHSEGLCDYDSKTNTCSMNSTPCTRFGHHHLSHGALIGISVIAFSVFLCTCTCCALACRKRRQRLAGRCRARRAAKKAAKAAKAAPVVPAPEVAPITTDEESVVPLQEQQQAVYIPLQQSVQYMYNPQHQNYYTPYAVVPAEFAAVYAQQLQQSTQN